MPQFNLDTRPSKYFDAGIDPKSKREQERLEKSRQVQEKHRLNNDLWRGAVQSGQPVVDRSGDKIEVGYMRANGKITEKFEVYNNLDDIVQP